MKNIQDVLRGKEQQFQQLQQQAQQVQKEIEALRMAAKLLADDTDAAPARAGTSASTPQLIMRSAQPAAAPVKEPAAYVAPQAWDGGKPQFP